MHLIRKQKQISSLAILFTAVYMVSYITRINYGAIVVEMEYATKISRSLLSVALTGGFITYGIGQVISGFCDDKFSPQKLVSLALLVTSFMNLLIPICQNAYQMIIVWCVNGFAQAFIWPPLVRLMTELLSLSDYRKITVKVSCGSSFGTIVIYLISPLVISVLGWKWVFVFSALCGFIMLFLWNKQLFEIGVTTSQSAEKDPKESRDKGLVLFFILTGFAIVFQGMLRDGVTTWMPSYISETYHLGNIISILTGVVLPLFAILSFYMTSFIYKKKFTNPFFCATLIFGVGVLAAIGLVVLFGKKVICSILLSALLTGCMHGVNLMLIGMLPVFFKGRASTISGILNSCTYIGSAISTYGIALISEKYGWEITLATWLIVAILGTLMCLICSKIWNRNKQYLS